MIMSSSSSPTKKKSKSSLLLSLLPIIISYSIMIIAQTCGPTIIEFLHGYDALINATTTTTTKFVIIDKNKNDSPSRISSSSSSWKKLFNKIFKRRNQQTPTIETLTFCEEYEAAHYNKVSDILHVSGMISVLLILWLLIVIPYLHLQQAQQQQQQMMTTTTTRSRSSNNKSSNKEDSKKGKESTTTITKTTTESSSSNDDNDYTYLKICINLFVWIPPIYYIPAWIGHFVFQKDIPAVFTYAQTFVGWKTGEICAYKQLFEGRMLSYPHEYGIAITLSFFMVILILFQSIQHIPWYDNDDIDDIDNIIDNDNDTKSIEVKKHHQE